MIIKNIHLEYVHKSGFSSAFCDGICHVKTLPYLSVVQAVEGSYDIKLGNGETYNTGSGGFFIAPSDIQQTITHHADKVSGNMVCRWVFFKIKINELYDFDHVYHFPVIPECYQKELHALFNRLFATDTIFDEYVCYYEIVRWLSLISKRKEHTLPLQKIDVALTYIKENYKNKITVSDIAQKTNFSESYLFSIFKTSLGVSPISYLNNYRLSVAADELLKSDKTIVEIANMVGVEDSVYFNKLFRKAYQMSPSQYREMYKNSSE